jgi:hypothetical protein
VVVCQLDEDERIAREAIRYVNADWQLDSVDNVAVSSALTTAGEQLVPITADRWRRPMVESTGIVAHVAAHDPARVLREVDAKRLLLTRWSELQDRIEAEPDQARRGDLALTRHGLDMFVYQLGTVYADRPGYREEWRP